MEREDWEETVKRFHQAHEKVYGFQNGGSPVELVNLRLSAVGKADHAGLYVKKGAAAQEAQPFAVRSVYYAGKWVDTGIYDREGLAFGHRIKGPAIIEEKGATTVMWPGDEALVDERGNLVIAVASQKLVKKAIAGKGGER